MKLKSATQGATAIQILTLLPGKEQVTCRSSSPSTPLVPPPALLQPLLPLCPVFTDHTDILLQHSSPTQHYFIPVVSGKSSAMPARGASRPAEQSAQLPRGQIKIVHNLKVEIETIKKYWRKSGKKLGTQTRNSEASLNSKIQKKNYK